MANVLTGIRIICGLLLLSVPAFSGRYCLLYLLGGFTDAIDGTVARKTGRASDFGSAFDTVADFVFAAAVAVKLASSFPVPPWLAVWIAVITAVKLCGHAAGYIRRHEFRTVHSVWNKLCGGYVFIAALFIGGRFAWQAKAITVTAACVLSTAAATAECIALCGGKRQRLPADSPPAARETPSRAGGSAPPLHMSGKEGNIKPRKE